jgi:RNA polymerase sigma factor (sigma-70 family)
MIAAALTPVMRYLSRLAGLPAGELNDAELLERFHTQDEEAAFTLLVQRHGPMVLRVCQRVLGNAADADDAFQATFLVLLRKADSARWHRSLGCWLHGVAWREAIKARSRRITPGPDIDGFARTAGDPAEAAALRELLAVIDEEIRRLPQMFRAPLVLCGLEGKTCEQAARELRWPKSTLAHRLGKARNRLRRQLLLRGFAVPATLLAASLTRLANGAVVPALMTLTTVRLAKRVTAGSANTPTGYVVHRATIGRWLTAIGLTAAIGMIAATALFTEARTALPETATSPLEEPATASPAVHADREGIPLPAEALARVGSVRLRHGRSLCNPDYSLGHVDYSADGKLLLSSGCGSVRLWDTVTGKLVRQFTGESGRFSDGLFSADGTAVMTLDGETCRWFDTHSGQEVRHCDLKLPKVPAGGRFSPRGDKFAVADVSPGGELIIYDLPSGAERFRKAAAGSWHERGLSFSPDATKVAAVEQRPFGTCRLLFFDATSGKQIGEIELGKTYFEGWTFSPDGTKLLGHNARDGLRVWNMPEGKLLYHFDQGVRGAAFSPDGASIAIAPLLPDNRVVDLTTGKELQRFRSFGGTYLLAFAPDRKTLADGSYSGVIVQWDLASGKRLASSADPIHDFTSLQFAAGDKLLWRSSNDFAAVDWHSGREVRRAPLPDTGEYWFGAFSPDRSRVAGTKLNAEHSQHIVWDAVTGKELCAFPTVAKNTGVVQLFSPDGQTLYTAEWQGRVRALDVNSGREISFFDKRQHFRPILAISPNGRWLAAADLPPARGSQPEITLWDLSEGRESRQLVPRTPNVRARDLAFSPDSTQLVAIGYNHNQAVGEKSGCITIWDVRTGEEKFVRTGLGSSLSKTVVFSPDGRLLATGGWSGDLQLWEIATGEERHHFTGHELAINSIAFSPDGKLLAAASSDAPLFVWDVEGCYGKPPSVVPFSAEEKANLWTSLDDADAAIAFGAMRRLLARPRLAVALLHDRLRQVAPVDDKAVRQLLRQLDADAFAVREKAAADLAAVADTVEPLLRKLMSEKPSPEAGRQLERALASAASSGPERRREVRAIEVLERIGTTEARELLRTLAGGVKEAKLTREAHAAIERLK